MENKKIKVVAKIERDARNYFFVKMLYGIVGSNRELETVYEIEDSRLFDTLIEMSNNALKFLGRNEVGNVIVIYYTRPGWKSWYSENGLDADYTNPTKVIAGTLGTNDLNEINYLIGRISKVISVDDMGEFWIQYGEKLMTKEGFYDFQKELSI